MTDDGVLWPLGLIHTPNNMPVVSLQLYSIAGAKPMCRLDGKVCSISGP
jgi:hypothetical protein